MESIIDEVATMGFSRHEVRDVIMELNDRGKAVRRIYVSSQPSHPLHIVACIFLPAMPPS